LATVTRTDDRSTVPGVVAEVVVVNAVVVVFVNAVVVVDAAVVDVVRAAVVVATTVVAVAAGAVVVEAITSSVDVVATGPDAMRTSLTDLSGRPAIAPPATTPTAAITANLSHDCGCTQRTVAMPRALTA
jgi:hypothetical protein